MSKRVVAGLLLVVALLSGAGMVVAGPAAPPATTGESGAKLTTGVLSPRRVPAVMSQLVGRVRLEHRLLAILHDERYADADLESCLVVEHAGETLFAHQADRQVIPASTLKLVTGWAALRRLGPAHRLVTEVRAAARPEGGVVDRLWLVGGGDPLLSTEEYAAHFANQPQIYTSLDALADSLVRAGVTTVLDRVYGDATRYDAQRYLPSWKEGYLADNEVGPVAGLVVNDNFAIWRPEDVAAPDPAAHGAAALTALLAGRGVALSGPAAGGVVPTSPSVVLATIESPPMTAVVGQMLAESDNLTAEMLVKELGHRFGGGGTWAAGLEVIRETLSASGYPTDAIVQHDGSGLERDNRLSCALLMDLLDDEDHAAALAVGLPVAGESGTLRLRLDDPTVRGKVRAKTGSIDNVSGLVGYAESAGGTLEFALVGNGLPPSARTARDFADEIARAIVAYPDVAPMARLEPQPPVTGPAPASPPAGS